METESCRRKVAMRVPHKGNRAAERPIDVGIYLIIYIGNWKL